MDEVEPTSSDRAPSTPNIFNNISISLETPELEAHEGLLFYFLKSFFAGAFVPCQVNRKGGFCAGNSFVFEKNWMALFHFLQPIHGTLVMEFNAKVCTVVVNSLLNFYLLNSDDEEKWRASSIWGDEPFVEITSDWADWADWTFVICELSRSKASSTNDSSRMPLTWCLCNLSDGNKHPLEMKKQLASLNLILFALTTSPRLVNFSKPGRKKSSHDTACARDKHNIVIYRRKELMPTNTGNCK